MKNILSRSKLVQALVASAGAVAAHTATVVDCTGFDRVCYVLNTGAAAAGATMSFKITDAILVNMAGAADIAGAALAGLVVANDVNKIYAIDVPVNPARPFQVVAGAVGTGVFANSCTAMLYKGSGTYPKVAATQAIIL